MGSALHFKSLHWQRKERGGSRVQVDLAEAERQAPRH